MAIIRDDDSANGLFGTGSNDTIFGNGGNDTIRGGGGNDRIIGSSGADAAYGGAGDDNIFVMHGEKYGDYGETIGGGTGFDTLLLSWAGSTGVVEFSFHDAHISSIKRLQLNSGANDITANFYLDPLHPTQFSPQLEFVGGAGKDTVNFYLRDGASLDLRAAIFTNWHVDDHIAIHSGSENCTVNGSQVSDEIWVNGVLNLFKGNGGDDLFIVDSYTGYATIDGGTGWDTFVMQTRHVDMLTRLIGIEEIRFQYLGSDTKPFFKNFYSLEFDRGFANPYFHFVDADTVANVVGIFMDSDTYFSAAGFTFENWGQENKVVFLGFEQGERIIGSTVNDQFYGRDGADVLTGGTGNDTFTYGDVTDSEVGFGFRDRIPDFAAGDKIDLSSLDASATLAGD